MNIKGRVLTPQELEKAFEEFKKLSEYPKLSAVLKRLADK